jgi:hypothetical protein
MHFKVCQYIRSFVEPQSIILKFIDASFPSFSCSCAAEIYFQRATTDQLLPWSTAKSNTCQKNNNPRPVSDPNALEPDPSTEYFSHT